MFWYPFGIPIIGFWYPEKYSGIRGISGYRKSRTLGRYNEVLLYQGSKLALARGQ